MTNKKTDNNEEAVKELAEIIEKHCRAQQLSPKCMKSRCNDCYAEYLISSGYINKNNIKLTAIDGKQWQEWQKTNCDMDIYGKCKHSEDVWECGNCMILAQLAHNLKEIKGE
jgi:hypothetical protein